MPKMLLKVEAKKFTTRDGSSPYDLIYIQQQRDEIASFLENMGFSGDVQVEIVQAKT